MRIYLLLFPFLFAQDNTQQVEINISTTVDIAFAGKIFLNTTQYASKGLYKEEVDSKYEKFYVRMFAGGNKIVGKILSQEDQSLLMYSKSEKKYSKEMFQDIKKNNGIPTLKDITKMNPGGERGNENSSDTTSITSQAQPDREIARSISNDSYDINGFNCQKITTRISDANGSVLIEEWISNDTSLFIFVNNELSSLTASYGGTHNKSGDSANWIKAIDPNKKITTIPGEIIKSSIVWKNDEGKNTFSMTREVLSAVFSDFNSSEFKISNKFKKVSELD